MPREDGYKNLVPMDQRSKDEARSLGAQGGLASGASRRRRRSLREAADIYLSLPPADKRRWNKLSRQGIDPEDIDNQMAMIAGLTERAIKGDARAAKVVIDLLGERTDQEEAPTHQEDDPITKSLKETSYAIAEADQNTSMALHRKEGTDL